MNPIVGGFALLFIISRCQGTASDETKSEPEIKKHVLGELRVGDCFRRFESNEFETDTPDPYVVMVKKLGKKDMIVLFFNYDEPGRTVEVIWPIDTYERSERHWKVSCKTGKEL